MRVEEADPRRLGAVGAKVPAVGLIDTWQAAGRPVEFHLYEKGGHGFGLGKKGTTSPGWFSAFVSWLDANGFLKPAQ